jgi:hypothetical protein
MVVRNLLVTSTNMNVDVNVMCHALVVVVRRRVVSLMLFSAQSLWSLFSHSRWGRGGMTGEPRLFADQGVCYWSETIKR